MNEYLVIIKLLISSLLSSLIGYEREVSEKPFGVRTAVLVGVAATLFTSMAKMSDLPYLLGSVVAGVGFIGGGVITKEKDRIRGLTTAAVIWVVTAIGMAIGLEYYLTAFTVTIISFTVLRFKKLESEFAKRIS